MSRQFTALVFLCAWLSIAPGSSFADSFGTRLYGEINAGLAEVSHSDLDFYPGFASISGGVWLWRGIGAEVFFDQGLSSDADGQFDMEITRANGFALRFQSPPADGGLFAYLLLGVVGVRLEQEGDTLSGGRQTIIQNYRGGRISIGIGERIKRVPGLIVTGEYRNYFVDEDLTIDAISLGLRFSLR